MILASIQASTVSDSASVEFGGRSPFSMIGLARKSGNLRGMAWFIERA